MRLLIGLATHVQPKHDRLGCVAAKLGCRKRNPVRKQLDVGTAEVDLLIVLDGVSICLRWPLSTTAAEMPLCGPNLYDTCLTAIEMMINHLDI